MNIAVSSDEYYPIHDYVVEELKKLGHSVTCFGALLTKETGSWVDAAKVASEAVRSGKCDEAILFCWTGTGVCITANRFPGIRAALCTDPQTAAGARTWNHANVLVLSNRILSEAGVTDILAAWLGTPMDERGRAEVGKLERLFDGNK